MGKAAHKLVGEACGRQGQLIFKKVSTCPPGCNLGMWFDGRDSKGTFETVTVPSVITVIALGLQTELITVFPPLMIPCGSLPWGDRGTVGGKVSPTFRDCRRVVDCPCQLSGTPRPIA